MQLIQITEQTHTVFIEMKYATADNFVGRIIYENDDCLLHPDAVIALEKAIAHAANMRLKLRIYDAFRPASAQYALWEVCPNPDYVADPAKGSHHTRGVAIDLTLCNDNGVPLDMGTGFDALIPESAHDCHTISAEAARNRAMLAGIMYLAGFTHTRTEWWHYQLPNARNYPLL